MSFCIRNTNSSSFTCTLAPKEENNFNNIVKDKTKDKQELAVFNAYDNVTQNTNSNNLSEASVLIFNKTTKSWSFNSE